MGRPGVSLRAFAAVGLKLIGAAQADELIDQQCGIDVQIGRELDQPGLGADRLRRLAEKLSQVHGTA